MCRPGQIQNYGVDRQETAKISCELEANPHEVNFTWRFNSSSTELLDIPVSLVAVDRAKSIAHYTPNSSDVKRKQTFQNFFLICTTLSQSPFPTPHFLNVSSFQCFFFKLNHFLCLSLFSHFCLFVFFYFFVYFRLRLADVIQDYGTLLCWGSNEIGTQSEPCIFNINPAGRF